VPATSRALKSRMLDCAVPQCPSTAYPTLPMASNCTSVCLPPTTTPGASSDSDIPLKIASITTDSANPMYASKLLFIELLFTNILPSNRVFSCGLPAEKCKAHALNLKMQVCQPRFYFCRDGTDGAAKFGSRLPSREHHSNWRNQVRIRKFSLGRACIH
jgi:hypothetical protein